MKNINVSNFLFVLLTALVVKTIVLGSINLPEAIVCVVFVVYAAFDKYMEHKKAKEIEKSFEERIKNVESKLAFIDLGKLVSPTTQRSTLRR